MTHDEYAAVLRIAVMLQRAVEAGRSDIADAAVALDLGKEAVRIVLEELHKGTLVSDDLPTFLRVPEPPSSRPLALADESSHRPMTNQRRRRAVSFAVGAVWGSMLALATLELLKALTP